MAQLPQVVGLHGELIRIKPGSLIHIRLSYRPFPAQFTYLHTRIGLTVFYSHMNMSKWNLYIPNDQEFKHM